MKPNLSSLAFRRLVTALKETGKTCSTIEQSCGGLISSSIMAQPGASRVYFGGTIAYNTKQSQPLLLNDSNLYNELNAIPSEMKKLYPDSEADGYIQSKVQWTALTSVAYCKAMNTDYAIAEGGATGPTFRPTDMKTGFSVIAVAGRNSVDGTVSVLRQEIVQSKHSNRTLNMRFFADAAADLTTSVVTGNDWSIVREKQQEDDSYQPSKALQLDRATHLRSDKKALDSLQEQAQYVVLQGKEILVRSGSELALLDQKQLVEEFGKGCASRRTFLGFIKNNGAGKDHNRSNMLETPVFGIDILGSNNEVEEKKTHSHNREPMYTFVDTRTTAPLFNALHNELALHATALAEWQRRTRHCTLCGSHMEFVDGCTRAVCTGCDTSTWPRQDPSMIVVVSSRCQQRVLLARSTRHPPKLHTVLAGFVEAGETFEAAVAREVYEETGVSIDEGSVQYLGSQPWPFPQSCMIGFQATADDSTSLVIDPKEIVSAAWFTKSDVSKASKVQGATMQQAVAARSLEQDPTLPLLIPPRGVIARKLIDHWLDSD